MSYTKESLNSVLEVEGPKVSNYLTSKGLPISAESVKSYYTKQGKKVGQNAVKKMIKHLNQS